MKPAVHAALTDLHRTYKELVAGKTNSIALQIAQDALVGKLPALFAAHSPEQNEEDPEHTAKNIFRLINTRLSITEAIVELPEDPIPLLKEIFNDEMKLDVEYGGDFTFDLVCDPSVSVVVDLHNAYKSLMRGSMFFHDFLTARDRVVKYVDLLFGTHERVILNTKEDVAKYIANRRGKLKLKDGETYSPTVAQRPILFDFVPDADPTPAPEPEDSEE